MTIFTRCFSAKAMASWMAPARLAETPKGDSAFQNRQHGFHLEVGLETIRFEAGLEAGLKALGVSGFLLLVLARLVVDPLGLGCSCRLPRRESTPELHREQHRRVRRVHPCSGRS